MNFLHIHFPEPIALSIGSLDIYWYGLIIALAVVVGLVLVLKLSKKSNVSTDHVYNLVLLVALSGLIGGRIGHLIGEWDYYRDNLGELVKIWNGGIAIHGVLLAGLLVVFFYARRKKLQFWKVTDLIVVALPLMQAIGRWGNYFNQELFGKPTSSPFGIPIELQYRPAEYLGYDYFHPAFLYESLAMLAVFGVMLLLYSRSQRTAGTLTLIYFMQFSLVRFMVDFVKIDLLKIGPLLLTQWISLVIFFLAVLLLWYGKRRVAVAAVPEIKKIGNQN